MEYRRWMGIDGDLECGRGEVNGMRVAPVYNVSLLHLIKQHSGLSIEDIQNHEDYKDTSIATLENELVVLLT